MSRRALNPGGARNLQSVIRETILASSIAIAIWEPRFARTA